MNTEDIGSKIRSFRKSRNLTQLELEHQIDAASGMISRIENGETNPTRETLEKISEALKLSLKEVDHLHGLKSLYPTDTEISLAIDEVNDLFKKPETLAYLIDDWFRLLYVSDALINFLKIKTESLMGAVGKNLLEVFLNPEYGVRQNIDPDYLIENFALEFARARQELTADYYGNHIDEIVERIKGFPDFEEIWSRSGKISKETLSPSFRTSYLIINGQKVKVTHARERLKQNPRFEIIELFNPIPYE